MVNMRMEANTAAPDAQNEQPSHSFVAPLAKSLGGTTDEDDEWEYEYSTTETETFYLTLDLTTPSIPTSRPLTVSSRNGRAGFRAKWLNPGLGRRKHLLGQAPTIRVDKDKNNEDGEDDELGDEDAPGETDNDYQPDEDEQTQAVQSRDKEPKEHKIQILELESDNPLVSYRDHIFTCNWARNIGTELLFTDRERDRERENILPTLRKLKGGVDLLGACTARITSSTATLVPIARVKDTELAQEEDGPLVESISAAASDARRNQARFLERLMKVKKEKGEKDEVTVVAYKRLRWNGWVELMNKRRNEEREDIRRKLRRAEGEAKTAFENRLKELDDEEKNMPADAPRQGEGDAPDEADPALKPQVKRRRKKRVKVLRNEPVPEGVELRTGERTQPIRRRPRGDWKRYNVDGTIAQPVLEAPKVPGDKTGSIWKGWHEGIDLDEEDDEDEANKSDNGDQDEEDEDGGAVMTGALSTRGDRRDSSGADYETQWDDHQASSVVGQDFDRSGFHSSPLKGNMSVWDDEDDERPGSSHQQPGIGFRDTPPVLSRAVSHVGIGFRDDHATSAPVSFHGGVGFEDGHAASAPESVHGIGFRDDQQQHSFEGIGAAHEDDDDQEMGGTATERQHPEPPPGGWMGLLEGDDIPQLPQ